MIIETSEEIYEAYFSYIYECISGLNVNDKDPLLSKRSFAKKLFELDYKPAECDESRSVDGCGLRYMFEMSMRDSYYSEKDFDDFKDRVVNVFKDKPCSMLEMMVALSDKMEDIMSDDAYPDRHYMWINKMIVSLGIGGYSQRYINEHPEWEKEIETAINTFNKREYSDNGKGGLFFISPPKPETVPKMNELPLWDQALIYMNKISD